VTVSDLFAGAIVPGFALVAMYILYLVGMAVFFPHTSPAIPPEPRRAERLCARAAA
jgi:TRAP-type mannitol/chloroaromatic compound transport system permease large subunit